MSPTRDVVFEEYNDLILRGRGRSAVAAAPSAPGRHNQPSAGRRG